jgi:dynein light chain Tctex-type 1
MSDEVSQVAAQVEKVDIGAATALKSKYFDKESIHKIVYNGLDKTLTGQTYKRENAKQWIEAVTETTMAHLNQYQQQKKEEFSKQTQTPDDHLVPVVMKYMVHVVLLKKSPSVGFHSATSAIWDPNTDGMCSVAWENDSMHCLITVFEVNAI